VVPRFGHSAREIATTMADGGVVPHSTVVSVAPAMRKLEADALFARLFAISRLDD
jgi:hypothetical protein